MRPKKFRLTAFINPEPSGLPQRILNEVGDHPVELNLDNLRGQRLSEVEITVRLSDYRSFEDLKELTAVIRPRLGHTIPEQFPLPAKDPFPDFLTQAQNLLGLANSFPDLSTQAQQTVINLARFLRGSQ